MCQLCITFRQLQPSFVEKLGLQGRFIISIDHAWELLNRYVEKDMKDEEKWFAQKKKSWDTKFIIGDIDLVEEKSLPLEYWRKFERIQLHNYFVIYKLPVNFVIPEISDIP